MKRRSSFLVVAPLLASIFLTGCIFLTKEQLQSIRFFLRTSQALPAGELTEVYSSIFPAELKLKGNFVKVFGRLDLPQGASPPSKVLLEVASVDAVTERAYYRFKLSLNVAANGSYSGIKKWTKNLKPDTLQLFAVQPQGAAIPAGTKVSICVDMVKKKTDASSDASCSAGGGSPGGGNVTTVQVLDNRFDPKSITVEPGDTVRWVLAGTALDHTTTESGSKWNSGLIFTSPGASFEVTFGEVDRDRTYEYYCATHRGCCQMQGSIRIGMNAPAPNPGY